MLGEAPLSLSANQLACKGEWKCVCVIVVAVRGKIIAIQRRGFVCVSNVDLSSKIGTSMAVLAIYIVPAL